MAEHKRGLSGSASSGRTRATSSDKINTAKYWVSHRMGPFLIHEVGKGCEPQRIDNAGYTNDIDSVINQGFAPCPRCMKEV